MTLQEPIAIDDLTATENPWESTADREPLLVAGDVAALLRVTTAWVYAETRRGALPHVRMGRYVRYRRSAILRWVAERESD